MVNHSLVFILFLLFAITCISSADDWWEFGQFYQVYPRSFQDSDGDGIGDLNGITDRLEYFKEIGMTGIWLSPIFLSPMRDFGYDITDFRAIQPEYGTMDDFKRLVKRCKDLDVKIILDFVPNHTADDHEWFKKATNPNHPEHKKYKDYFIWNEGRRLENGTRAPPSNWLSIFRGSAWTWHDTIGAYYLHQFLPQQPDLNYRNQVVKDEMNEVLRFWLRLGVDGFRIDAIPYIFEIDKNSQGVYDDEPKSGYCLDKPLDDCYLDHIHTKDLDETFDIVYEWRRVMEEPEFSNHTR